MKKLKFLNVFPLIFLWLAVGYFFSEGAAKSSAAFKPSPTVSPSELPSESPSESPSPIKVVSTKINDGMLLLFAGESANDVKIEDATVELDHENDADEAKVIIGKPAGDGNIWTITAGNVSNTTPIPLILRKKADGMTASIADTADNRINVKIHTFTAANQFQINLNQPVALNEVFGINENLTGLVVTPQSSKLNVADGIITGTEAGTFDATVQIPGTGEKSVKFNVVPPTRTLTITDKPKSYEIRAGTEFSLKAESRNEENKRTSDEIVWEPAEADKRYVTLIPDGDTANLFVLESKQEPVKIIAKLRDNPTVTAVYSFFAKGAANVVGFGKVDMRLDIMDERTAQDLFGGVAVKDYMIAKLRIYHRVPTTDNGGPSSSILFFSEGLEINVSLEKRAQEKTIESFNNKSGKPKNKTDDDWKFLDANDIEYINNWSYIPSVDDDLISYFITRKKTACDERMQFLIGNRTCQLASSSELDRLWYFYEREKCRNSDTDCRNKAAQKNWIPFRPYAFLVMASTHDRRSERSTRERMSLVARGLASAASFGFAFAPAANNVGLVSGLDRYTNLFIPSLEKLFPSRREVQRKNILDMVLQPVEEVSYGKEVSKVVFLPKDEILGVIPGYDVRIVGVSVSKIKAEVSVLQKEAIVNR